MEQFYNRKDIAAMLGCSAPTVAEIFNRPDFPAQIFGRRQVIEREAFHKWLQTRHTINDMKRSNK